MVVAISSEIGRIHERRAARVQLGDESVVSTTAISGLDGAYIREISRSSLPCHISVSRRVYGDPAAAVVPISAEVGRI